MIIQNAIKITENHPEEYFLVSSHRHDYVTYTFKNGKSVSVDGGSGEGGYLRRAYTDKLDYGTLWMEWNVDDKEPLSAIKEKLLWGTYGKDGKSPLKYVLLKNCETEHLQLILKQPKLGKLYSKVIKSILKDRLPVKKKKSPRLVNKKK